jgi:hypothetical protein
VNDVFLAPIQDEDDATRLRILGDDSLFSEPCSLEAFVDMVEEKELRLTRAENVEGA